MPEFEELLALSLNGINSSFEKAIADLQGEVAHASHGISNVSGGKATLKLLKNLETELFATYRLVLEGASMPELGIGFRIDMKGYPIRTGNPGTVGGKMEGELNSKEEIRQFLRDLASNPDSPLVLKLAFLLRHKNSK